MRMKFKKGITPEAIAETFVRFVYENNIEIGAVNMYIQTLDGEVDGEYFVCTPGEVSKNNYSEYAANIRRSKLKAVR